MGTIIRGQLCMASISVDTHALWTCYTLSEKCKPGVIKMDLGLIRKYVTFSQDKTAISKNQFLTKLVLYMNVISRNCLRRILVLLQ